MTMLVHSPRPPRTVAISLAVLLALPLFAGCGRQEATAPPPTATTQNTANTATATGNVPAVKKPGLNNTQKGAIVLAGAAALYYLYEHHKHATAAAATGAEGQYYLSKNGRVYYRDANHQAHWVTPPANGISVPASEAQRYSEYQGYDNRSTGRDLTSLPEAQSATY